MAAYKEGMRRFRVTSLFGLTLLKDFDDVQITVTYPLPLANSLAVLQMSELGVHSATAWIELDDESLKDLLDRVKSGMEIYSFGRPHLLSTRANVAVKGSFRDGRGARFSLKERNGLSRVYGDAVIKRSVPINCSTLIDLRNAQLDEKNTTLFNDKRQWQ